MKTIKVLVICMLAVIFAHAQNVPPFALDEVEVIPPKFSAIMVADGQNQIHKFISESFHTPVLDGRAIEGTEVVQFIVNPSGKLSDYKVINSVSKHIDKEIIRILKKTDNMWIPGQSNGTPVAMESEIAVAIKIGESNPTVVQKEFTRSAQPYFTKGAKNLLIHGNAKRAAKNLNVAIRYKPYDRSTLTMLALCKIQLGEDKAAQAYISRIKKLGDLEISNDNLTERIQHLDGFDELRQLLARK